MAIRKQEEIKNIWRRRYHEYMEAWMNKHPDQVRAIAEISIVRLTQRLTAKEIEEYLAIMEDENVVLGSDIQMRTLRTTCPRCNTENVSIHRDGCPSLTEIGDGGF